MSNTRWQVLQKELKQNFLANDLIGPKLSLFKRYENKYDEYVSDHFTGHIILANSFFDFYADTIATVSSYWNINKSDSPPNFNDIILWHMSILRSLRACDLLFHRGYPLDGFARLRYLKESALFLSAILSGITTFPNIMGINQISKRKKFDWDEYRDFSNEVKAEENRVLNLMLRIKSGFSEAEKTEIGIWESLFNLEVHGGRFTYYFEIMGDRKISIVPVPKAGPLAMFVNRYCEIAWMLHRTLPSMQLSSRRLSPAWGDKWILLDSNFCEMERGLARTGKNIALIFEALINKKFDFDQNTCYDGPR